MDMSDSGQDRRFHVFLSDTVSDSFSNQRGEGQRGQMANIQITSMSALSYAAFERSSTDPERSSLTREQKKKKHLRTCETRIPQPLSFKLLRLYKYSALSLGSHQRWGRVSQVVAPHLPLWAIRKRRHSGRTSTQHL